MKPDDTVEPTRLIKLHLARALGISRPTLDSYLNRTEPFPPQADKDGAYSIEEVAKYISGIKSEGGEAKNAAFWKCEKLRLECKRIGDDIDIRRGKFIDREEVGQTIIPLISELGQLLTQKFELELPPRYKGKDTVECAEINRVAVDLIVTRFRGGTKAFTAEQK